MIRDFNILKYSEGVRQIHPVIENPPDEEVPDSFSSYANIMQMINDQNYTLIFHQPQRFCDDFWRILAGLEEFLGSLVGCSIHWTPKNSQGIAPQWDSVDSFVLQVERCI